MKNSVSVVISSDNNYAQHAGVAINSVLLSRTSNYVLDFYFLDGGINSQERDKIKALVLSHENSTIQFLAIDRKFFEGLPVQLHFTDANYYRLKTASILPYLDKVIYIDCDLVFKHDILDLWNIDIEGYCLGAVEDTGGWLNHCPRLSIPPASGYFNSGVLLMNLKLLREQDYENKLFSWINENKSLIQMVDQDVLNAVCFDTWLPISPAWNVTYLFSLFKGFVYQRYSNSDIDKALKSPYVVHFAGFKTKPWMYMDHHIYKNEYYYYLKKTPWENYTPPDKTCFNMIKKYTLLKLAKLIHVTKIAHLKSLVQKKAGHQIRTL